jgi:tetratricopeptide (TPR) repeat protein
MLKLILPKIIILQFLVCYFFLQSVNADTLVAFKNLTYHSEFEKEAFFSLENTHNPNYFKLFLASDPDINDELFETYQSAFNVLISPFKNEKFESLTEKKKVKKVYKDIHSAILDKYVATVSFSSIFERNEYQCVTASMLYLLSFEKTGISYEIEMLPDHVFLRAFPKTSKIVVETTDPNRGTFVYDQKFKGNFVNYLRENKLISKEEHINKTVDELFQQYFLKSEVVNKTQLASAQYYNIALKQIENQKMNDAFNSLKKAYYLHPTKKHRFFLLFVSGMVIDQTRASDAEYASLLNLYIKLIGNNISSDHLVSFFGQMTEHQLNFDGNVKLYKKSYHTFIDGIKDSTLLNEINFIYNYEMGRREYQLDKKESCGIFFEKAHALKPDNINAQHMFVSSILLGVESKMYSPEELPAVVDTLESLINKYEKLQENDQIKNLQSRIYLDMMDFYYFNKELENAINFQSKFENTFDKENKNAVISLNKSVAKAYSTAASYYFRKGQYRKTKELLNRGLEYSPNNYFLKSRLESLD